MCFGLSRCTKADTPRSHLSLPSSMASTSFPAFIGQSPVTILLDPSSSSSRISPAIVHKLDLPCPFTISGTQVVTADLHVPTDGGGYHSRLAFLVSYDLGSNLVLGNDWLAPCKPVLAGDLSSFLKPLPSTVDDLLPPHSWHPTKRSFFISLAVTLYLQPIQLPSGSLKAFMMTLKRVRRWHP